MAKHKPKLGQNFLVDDGARHAIADALGDVRGRTIVEIGPGGGAITEILAGRAKRLVAVELDREFAERLRAEYAGRGNVEIVEADFLEVSLTELVGTDAKASVIGNLPYYITSDILLKLFDTAHLWERAVLMMQREVAERVAAQPGTRDYGLLSVTAQLHGEVSSLFTLAPSAFLPPPEVHSSVVRVEFRPRFAELGVEKDGFIGFLRGCFAQKRKTLGNNLRAAGLSRDVMESRWPVGIARDARAEALSVEQLATIYKALR
jgi:16S rRNA (adenine1518-N6/adenine1519-N6)-dimethyltransferase